MKKGAAIKEVTIENGRITAMSQSGEIIKLTRHQRSILSQYKNSNYINDIKKAFDNANACHPEFRVIVNGETVFTL